MWLLPDIQRYRQTDQAHIDRLKAEGLTEIRQMELNKAGVLSRPLVDKEPGLKATRARKSLYKTHHVNPMDEIRRAREEDEFVDECAICKTSTYLHQVRCTQCHDKLGCLEHGDQICECPLSCKVVEYRYPEAYMDAVINTVSQRANRPAAWKDRAEQLLTPASDPSDLQPLRVYQSMVTEADRFPRFLTWVPTLRDRLKEIATEGKAWTSRAQTLLAAISPVGNKGKSKDAEDLPTIGDIEELVQDAEGKRVLLEDLPALKSVLVRIDAWRSEAKAALAETNLPSTELGELLAGGESFRVQMPEIKKVAVAWEMRQWQETAVEAMSQQPCNLDQLRMLLSTAEVSRFNAPEAKTIKDALTKAEVLRSKITKARDRGTTLAALKGMLEEENDLGLHIELVECAKARVFITKCEDWRERVCAKLDIEKPPLRELELLQTEYKAFGVYIDMNDELKPRVTEGQAWLSKAKKLAPTMIAWHPEWAERATQQDYAGVEPQFPPAQMAIMDAPSMYGSPLHANATVGDVGGRSSGAKRASDAHTGERESGSKRQKKTDEFEYGTDRIHFFSKSLPSFVAVRDLVMEGEKLRSDIDEYLILCRGVEKHQEWLQRVGSALQNPSTPLLDLFQGNFFDFTVRTC
jgi:hypothetical protein